MKPRVVLIGPGRLGQAIGRLLADADYEITAVISRSPDRALAAARFIGCRGAETTDLARAAAGELVLIALPDDHLGAMAANLRRRNLVAAGATLVHCSGIHPAAILLGEAGPPLRALAIHPLQSFADAVMGVRNIPGSPFSVEGTEEALALGEELVNDLGGQPFRIDADRKPLYHAAACVASNYLVTLVSAACQMMTACGFSEQEAFALLGPLMRGTGQNLAVLGPELALTGPIARGDVHTVAKHLKAIAPLPEGLQQIYRTLGRQTVELAWKKGTLERDAGEILLKRLADES